MKPNEELIPGIFACFSNPSLTIYPPHRTTCQYESETYVVVRLFPPNETLIERPDTKAQKRVKSAEISAITNSYYHSSAYRTLSPVVAKLASKPDLNQIAVLVRSGIIRPADIYSRLAEKGYPDDIGRLRQLVAIYGRDSLEEEATLDPHLRRNAVYTAAAYGCPKILRVLLEEYKCNANSESRTYERDARGTWALYHSSQNANHECIRLLLDHGADMYALSNSSGNLALHSFIQFATPKPFKEESMEIVKHFLKLGFEVDTKDGLNNTIMDVARAKDNQALIKFLSCHW